MRGSWGSRTRNTPSRWISDFTPTLSMTERVTALPSGPSGAGSRTCWPLPKAGEKSIGDLETQLEFLWKELTESYASLAQMLLSASSVRAASDAVLLQFERPADQSETAKARRAAYGQKYYDQFAGKEAAAMSNSPLVSYTKLSPNHSGRRKHAIDTISIHCMAGDLTVESCGNLFASPSRKASSNYGIGSDGRIGLYVEECNRSWCTSSSSNDNRAITIEVANNGEPTRDGRYLTRLIGP